MTEPWDDRDFLRGTQYKTDANLAARQSIYAYQHPRIDLAARVLDLAAPAPSDIIVDVGCGNGMYLAELSKRGCAGRVLGVDPERVAETVAAAFPRTSDGHYAITSHCGCLVCENG